MLRFKPSVRPLASDDGPVRLKRRPWHPPALRSWNLILAALICWTIIGVLQTLLIRSEKHGGIIFAENVNNMALRESFMYLYFPTILAVIFSIYWAWIDLDAKRSEPFYQLNREDGTLGKDSLLLHYPTMFTPLVPFIALRGRHWLVFLASAATLVVMFGLVPTQAGIFSTRTTTRMSRQNFTISEGFVDSADLESTIEHYMFSMYAIVAHNETLPPYMTRDYALRPFAPVTTHNPFNGTWTAETTQYSMDTQCEEATPSLLAKYNTSDCQWPDLFGEGGYLAYVDNPFEFTAYFTTADKLMGVCQDQPVFFASFTHNTTVNSAPDSKSTALFCEMDYYEQSVEATVDSVSKAPIGFSIVGPRKKLSSSVPNFTTYFEKELTDDRVTINRGALPTTVIPSFSSILTAENLYPIGYMAEMAAVLGDRQLMDYLDPKVLEESLLKACRLNLARAMTEYVYSTFSTSTSNIGTSTVTSEAVVVEAVFAYIVEAFLGLISVSSIAIIYLIWTRHTKLSGGTLCSDPGSLAATMSLVADDEELLTRIRDLNHSKTTRVEQELMNLKFKLAERDAQPGITESDTESTELHLRRGSDYSKSPIVKATRPFEFQLGSGICFVLFFAIISIVLAVLFKKSKPNGLSLPSRNRLAQNLVRSYIPTAIAMLIEPMWILINRLLCIYLPFQELLKMNVRPERSINLNYSSVPPQLTIFKALRARHFLLASVCAMTLLANLLATAFAGLLFQDIQNLEIRSSFPPAASAKFLNASREHFESSNHFVVAESNYMHNTRLPPWTDGKRMFLPFDISQDITDLPEPRFRARTTAFSTDIECEYLNLGSNYELVLVQDRGKASNSFEMRYQMDLQDEAGEAVRCPGSRNMFGPWNDLEDEPQSCNATHLGAEIFVNMNESPDVPRFCQSTIALGWVRLSESPPGVCEPDLLYDYLTGMNRIEPNETQYSVDITPNQTIAKHAVHMACRPKLVVEDVTVVVDSEGYVQDQPDELMDRMAYSAREQEPYFSFAANRVMEMFVSEFYQPPESSRWHYDKNASDLLNYFINFETQNASLIDASQGLPQLSDVVSPLQKVYTKLFATWLALHRDIFLAPAANSSTSISGHILYKEERLLFKTPLFIISETILGIYIVIAILVYARRPAKFLPHLPNSIGTVVSYFAASTAVRDLKGTARLTEKEREAFLKEKGFLYGYGSYVGPDGDINVGIERAPFVTQTQHSEREETRWWRIWRRNMYSAVNVEE